MSLLIVVGTFIALFLLAFITGRRFGALGLALAAGVLLAQFAAPLAAEPLSQFDQYFGDFTSLQVSQMLLTIVPSLILLVAGPKYHNKLGRLIGSLLYAAMAALLLLPYLVINNDVVAKIADFQGGFIALGIVLAIVDMMFTHTKKITPPSKSH